ncbi:M20 family metallo-hydrolase [Chloroflexales bacterium ZM16-3]|nr:M20 family metallo-hydrolase [Chloroflexales bacterium ZM16-3]
MELSIDTATVMADLDAIAACSSSPPPGVTRVLYSAADMEARAYLRARCAEAGLVLREDGLGNLFARWVGSAPDLPAVASGSHIDAIPDSGRYDGTVGVVGALEAIRALKRAGFMPRRSIELLLFTAEEPTRFGIGCLGSRALCGALTPAQLREQRDAAGRGLEELRAEAGFSAPLEDVQLPAGLYHAFVELHIEQGPMLETEGLPIGVVRAIAAPASLRVSLRGVGGHAGAVLMPGRRDALLAAAEIALAVEQAALSTGSPDTVATTGVLRIEPGAVNSIPSAATLEIDVRDIADEPRDAALSAIRESVVEICERRIIAYTVAMLNADPPATCAPAVVEAVVRACGELGLHYQMMVSRAYHDSLFMARICPTAMIFIPCRGGVSHRPDELSSPEQIAEGVAVLARSLATLSLE